MGQPMTRFRADEALSRRNFLRGTAGAAATLGFGGLLAACGSSSGGGSGGGSGSLTFLSNDNDPESISWYKQINAAFQSGTKINISGQTVEPGDDFVTKLQSEIRAHQTPTFIPHLDETLAATLYASGVAQPADSLIEKIGKPKFAPGALNHHITKDGHYHSVPWTVNGMVFWYRSDMLEKAGLSKVTTFDEMLKYAKANTSSDSFGICLPFGQSTGCTRVFFNFLVNGGGHIVDKDLNVVFDSPENVQTMSFLQELSQYTPPGSATYEWGDMISKFTSKTCASSFYPGRMLGSVASDAPSLSDVLRVDLIPSPSGNNRLSYVKSEGPVLLEKGASAQLADKWILDYQFSPKWYAKFLDVSGADELPQITSMKSNPAFAKYPVFAKHEPIMKTLEQSVTVGVNYSREAPDFPINSNGGDIDNGTVMIEILQDLLVKKTDPKTVAQNGAAKLRAVMKGAKAI